MIGVVCLGDKMAGGLSPLMTSTPSSLRRLANLGESRLGARNIVLYSLAKPYEANAVKASPKESSRAEAI